LSHRQQPGTINNVSPAWNHDGANGLGDT
jgi:hypothetical protein